MIYSKGYCPTKKNWNVFLVSSEFWNVFIECIPHGFNSTMLEVFIVVIPSKIQTNSLAYSSFETIMVRV